MDLSFAKRLEVNRTNECVCGGVHFSEKRPKPGCCPPTCPITGDAAEGSVHHCFRGRHVHKQEGLIGGVGHLLVS